MRLFLFSTGAYAAVLTGALLLSLQLTTAQVRSSSNYQLQSDSINIGGGFSSSTNYVQESTVGEIATGPSDSSSYSLRAGYQQMQSVFIALTGVTAVIMDTDLPGITGGTSNGTSTLVVTTDSPSGYSLSIAASDSPAMQSTDASIADYNHGADPDFSFALAGSDAHFGYTPSGADIDDYFKDGGGLCNNSTGDTPYACWAGLATTARIIAQSIDATHPNGVTTTINFRVGIGSDAGVLAGVYTATTTVTAIPL